MALRAHLEHCLSEVSPGEVLSNGLFSSAGLARMTQSVMIPLYERLLEHTRDDDFPGMYHELSFFPSPTHGAESVANIAFDFLS